MLFYLKKILGYFFDPLVIALGLLLLAGAACYFRRRVISGVAFGTAVLILFVMSYDPAVRWLSRSVEFPPLELPEAIDETIWIVVLGSGVAHGAYPTAVAGLGSSSLARLATGFELYVRYPRSKLVVCGYGPDDGPGSGEMMGRAALAMGVERGDLYVLSEPRDTRGEATEVAALLGAEASAEREVFLVTSSVHLRRALAHFRALGLGEVFPVPAEPYAYAKPSVLMVSAPTSGTLQRAAALTHEWAGILWGLISLQFSLDDLRSP
ncbi:MAG: YdcF family protein [Puniceicoccaceae bacterium]